MTRGLKSFCLPPAESGYRHLITEFVKFELRVHKDLVNLGGPTLSEVFGVPHPLPQHFCAANGGSDESHGLRADPGSPAKTRHQFVTKTRQNRAVSWGYENAESKAGKGIYVCDLILDTVEVWGSSPHVPTIFLP